MLEIPGAAQGIDASLLLLRLTVALVFGTSGFNHLKSPRARAESLGLSVPLTVLIGAAEVAGALGLTFGVLTQWAALGLILIMFGAIYMKVVQWKTGFWGEKASGWHYEILFIVMNLTIVTTGGGHIALLPVR
ncbi:MAG TPA: DoxX family protein [Terracidiphilus sp.]|jgi:putative oxidoreductase|nr:DoxX family protein [Terracidiphilus sp.]